MLRRAIGLVLACAFAASAAWAQDLTGKWTATAVGNNVAVTLDLKVAGNVVTGAILIKDGKIEGNKISFYVLRTANNTTNKVLWQGTIEGEEIHFTRSVEGATGPAMQVVAKRAQ